MKAKSTPVAITIKENFGDPYEGGFFAGTIRMGGEIYGVAVALKAQGELKGLWLDRYESVPNACSFFDSMANTKAMAVAGSELANKVLGLEINGFKDWCIPSRDVLELCYRHFKPTKQENYVYRAGDNPSSIPAGYPYTEQLPAQTALTAFQAGGVEAFEDDDWYWSSTQYSGSNAWIQDFDDGDQSYGVKSYERRCRAVRLIQLST